MSAEPNLTDQDYELLSAYIDGALSESEQAMVEQRLKTDTLFQRELMALRQTVALINQLPTLKAPRNFTLDASMVQARKEDSPRPTPKVIRLEEKRPRHISYGMLSAVAAVFVVIFGGIFLIISSQQNTTDSAPAPMAVAAQPSPMASPEIMQQRAIATFESTEEQVLGSAENTKAVETEDVVEAQTYTLDEPDSDGAATGALAMPEAMDSEQATTENSLYATTDEAIENEVAEEAFSQDAEAPESGSAADMDTTASSDTARVDDSASANSTFADESDDSSVVDAIMTVPMDEGSQGKRGFLPPREQVYVIDDHGFKLSNDGMTWIDLYYVADTMPLTEISFASADYDALQTQYPKLTRYADKLGQQFIVLLDNIAYFITPQEGTATP